LLDVAYAEFGVFPTLLERDFDIPALGEMLKEVDIICTYQEKHADAGREIQVRQQA